MELISGNQAVVRGAIKAGAEIFAGYPITPASEIMYEWIAQIKNHQKKDVCKTFVQTEDEISAIHTIIGSTLAGKKSFTATSGPGFSLMQEGIGLAFIYETPIVIVNSMRVGPSTGMPTVSSQGDILQTQYGSHGDYFVPVYASNSVEEAYVNTIKSFNLAAKLSTPVIHLMDGFISQLVENVTLQYSGEVVELEITPLTKSPTPRYYSGLTTVKGIPKTKRAEDYAKWITPKLKKKELIKDDEYEFYGSENAENLIVAYGGVSRLVYEIVDKYPNKYSLFRPIRIFPAPIKPLIELAPRYKKIFSVEANQSQYSKILRAESLLNIIALPVCEGGKYQPSEIYKQIEKHNES